MSGQINLENAEANLRGYVADFLKMKTPALLRLPRNEECYSGHRSHRLRSVSNLGIVTAQRKCFSYTVLARSSTYLGQHPATMTSSIPARRVGHRTFLKVAQAGRRVFFGSQASLNVHHPKDEAVVALAFVSLLGLGNAVAVSEPGPADVHL